MKEIMDCVWSVNVQKVMGVGVELSCQVVIFLDSRFHSVHVNYVNFFKPPLILLLFF